MDLIKCSRIIRAVSYTSKCFTGMNLKYQYTDYGSFTPYPQPFSRGQNGRPSKLQTSQSYLYAWQDHGAHSPGNHARAHEKQQGGW